ncbi:putative late blight resistance protein homolog R1A-3 [Salvia splendens]|uniref:putative late blight resistance protein homolog R1A-3 n=1 Tax=Salvia splendens TaxID=180675 RepID=UPI001C280892|nr:putative late blight resistance protein homolog R1A-3 [Salvia splendens]
MAYNLQPLITILEGILDPHQSRWIVDENNPQLQSLLDKATSLQHLLNNLLYPNRLTKVTRNLGYVMEQAEKLIMEMEDKMMPRELHSAMEQLKLVDKKMPSSSSSSSKGAVGIDEAQGSADRSAAEEAGDCPHRCLLRCITGNECDQHIDELKVMLHKSLYGRKYLIVLDDIWSTKFWDEIKMYFPDNNKGSCIVITTRESDVAKYADSLSLQHHKLVFGEEECPPELQEIGRKIAKDSDGLPLAISVIGGLLSKMERSEDVWRKTGDSKDFEIRGSRLILSWVAEGFVKSNGERSLEEEAEDWLKSLIHRNLFQVRKYKRDGKPKSYSMHDMLRDMCIRKSAEDKFMNGPNKFTFSNSRRMSFYTSDKLEDGNVSTESMSLTRSVIWIGHETQYRSSAFSAARLLRVLDLMYMHFSNFPTEIFELVNLPFLGVNCYSIPRGISRLWNLQTLIGYCTFDEPAELWKLSELRYLNVEGIEFSKDVEMNFSVLKRSQQLGMLEVLTIENCSFDEIRDEEKEATKGDEFESEWDIWDETCDEEWELADGDEFPSLQFLYLEDLRLVRWIADETNFPKLRHLL